MDLIIWLIIGNILFIGSLVMLKFGKNIILKNNTKGKVLIYSSYIIGAIGVVLICIVLFFIIYLISFLWSNYNTY